MIDHPHQPGELWMIAAKEWPDHEVNRRARYLELLREHGHIVPKGDPRGVAGPLPCGWPRSAAS